MIKGMVSVIIPVHKGANFGPCVASVESSLYKNYEILVIDEGKERSAQRNIGIKNAKGEYLLILDSDMLLTPLVLHDCVAKMRYADAVYIPERIITKGFFARVRDWERQFYTATAVDVARFVRAKDCPLFDLSMSGPEDSDWDRRIKGCRAICAHPCLHQDNVGIIKFLKKKAYYSKSMAIYKRKWPDDKVLNFKWRCWTVFTENGKWKILISNPLYAMILCGLLFLRGLIYICAKKY